MKFAVAGTAGFFFCHMANIESSAVNEISINAYFVVCKQQSCRFYLKSPGLFLIFYIFVTLLVSIAQLMFKCVSGVAVHGFKTLSVLPGMCQNCDFITFDQWLIIAASVSTQGWCEGGPQGGRFPTVLTGAGSRAGASCAVSGHGACGEVTPWGSV